MAIKISSGEIKLTTGAETAPAPGATPDEAPFHIALLGDFTGRAGRGAAPGRLTDRRPVEVDRDNFEEVLARLGVEVQIPLGEGTVTLRITELEDFRPERLFQRVAAFEALRQLRHRLEDPATFAAAAEEVRRWSRPAAKAQAHEEASPEPVRDLSGGELLDQILGETTAPPRRPAAIGGEDWDAFLQQAVSPHLVPAADPHQADLVAQVDAAIGGLMRALLHHPTFQALEGAWRGAFFLVRRLRTDSRLKLFLVDVTRAEVAADLTGRDDLTRTGLYKLLVEPTTGRGGSAPWGLLAGLYTFGPRPADSELLGRLARFAQLAGAPVVAAAEGSLLGCAALAESADPDDWAQPLEAEFIRAWAALRQRPEAAYLGLALPRFLLRIPYGQGLESVEEFPFEEFAPGTPPHEAYLWGNPALAIACLLGEAFSRAGWGMRPGLVADLNDLPVHVHHEDGTATQKPCAEAWLSRRALEKIDQMGCMALVGIQGRDRVEVPSFRSVALGGTPLAGRWR